MTDSTKLDSDYILIFIDDKRSTVWIWQGSNVTTRMKFISAKLAPSVRDKFNSAYKIIAVDDGNEPSAFKEMLENDGRPINIDWNSIDSVEKDICKHCGSELPKGQLICPNCGNKVI